MKKIMLGFVLGLTLGAAAIGNPHTFFREDKHILHDHPHPDVITLIETMKLLDYSLPVTVLPEANQATIDAMMKVLGVLTEKVVELENRVKKLEKQVEQLTNAP